MLPCMVSSEDEEVVCILLVAVSEYRSWRGCMCGSAVRWWGHSGHKHCEEDKAGYLTGGGGSSSVG